MSFDDLKSGSVIHYPYLWKREAESGETEGRKSRPIAVGIRFHEPDGHDLVIFFPITTKEPEPTRFAAEVPAIEKRRGGLSVDLRLWIILDEYNEDVVGRSLYLEPSPPLGSFSKAFFLPLMKSFIARRSQARGVNRRG